jgi:phage terminase small subunit
MPRLVRIKYERFAQAIAKGANQGAAMITAGYAKKSARNSTELLKKKEIIERIKEISKELEKPTIADAVERREFLTLMMRGDVLSHGVVAGEATMVPPSARERVMAAELLSKLEGEFLQTNVTNVFNTLVIKEDTEELSMALSALRAPGEARVLDVGVTPEKDLNLEDQPATLLE